MYSDETPITKRNHDTRVEITEMDFILGVTEETVKQSKTN
jgi:hypothetical protein